MDGDVAPEGVIAGSNTGLSMPYGMFVRNNKIYVANNIGNDIRVFTAEVYGNVAPANVISCDAMYSPDAIYVTAADTAYITYSLKGLPFVLSDQMNVINNISTRHGLVTPDRTIKFSHTQPEGVVVDEANNRLFVALRNGNGINEYDGASSLNGTPTPTHHTTSAYQATPIAYDATHDQLYEMGDGAATIEVWNTASTIEGKYNFHITISGEGALGDLYGAGLAFDPTR